jgi:hypothetical protein
MWALNHPFGSSALLAPASCAGSPQRGVHVQIHGDQDLEELMGSADSGRTITHGRVDIMAGATLCKLCSGAKSCFTGFLSCAFRCSSPSRLGRVQLLYPFWVGLPVLKRSQQSSYQPVSCRIHVHERV